MADWDHGRNSRKPDNRKKIVTPMSILDRA